MVRKIYLYLLAGAMTLATTGCTKWLELEPKSEVAAAILFETPEGFSIALNGIYTQMSAPPLYGSEWKFSFVDILARCYDLKNTPYDGLKNYDYVSAGMDQKVSDMWALAYNSIANCNALLEQLDKKGNTFFTAQQRNMLEGETRAIRAMLYFDLLRLFAPAPIVADEAAIPYYGTLSNSPMPYRKTSEILDLILADLKRSKEIQRSFDTSIEAKERFHDYRFMFDLGFYSNGKRGFRMGYYATTAILARVALYAGEQQLAYDNAMELIRDRTQDQEPTVDFTSATVVDAGAYDRLLSEDIIFALYRTDYEEQFNDVTFLLPNTVPIFGTDLNSDYRKKCYMTSDGRQLLKFDLNQDREGEGDITSAISMVRLSEMYYIAAETVYDTDPDAALQLLNTLRAKRGCTVPLSPFATKVAFMDAVINDARREFIGEGQLFFLYKRLNETILDEAGGHQTLTDKFVLPIPEREVALEN